MLSLLLAIVAVCSPAFALDNGLGRVPQMGWNSWYDLMCDLNEQAVRETADALISTGLSKLGYTYINLDDCWAEGRYPNGSVYAEESRFPSKSLKPLADYVHSLGLKFGTYTDRGTKTCGGRPGSLGYEKNDADTYASWGIDYVKEDSCFASGDHDTAFHDYGLMRDALNASGRSIFFSLCGWNSWYAPVGQTLGNSWRIGPDDTNWPGVLSNININAGLGQYAGPGGWNDPCLLLAETETGDLRMTFRQTRTQFNFWAIMASPLLISANIRNMSAQNLETYSNAEVIAIDQDPLGIQGIRLVGGNLFPTSSASASLAQKSARDSKRNRFPGAKAATENDLSTKPWYQPGYTDSAGPAQVIPCNPKDPHMHWVFDTPASTYLFNNGTGKCLNVDNCQSDVILFDCVTTGGTCCGASCYKNMQFQITADNKLVSPLSPGQCAEVAGDNTINLNDCKDGKDSQYFTYDAQTHLIKQGTAGERCLTSATGSTNVWGRKITRGWAVLFVNTGADDVDVTCDRQCFAAMGFPADTTLQARDVWQHASFTVSSNGYTASFVPADGGSVMIVFSS